MKLDKHSNIPLYCQLKDYIIEKIDSGDYKTGSKIPSEAKYCEEFNLSRPTVRQAISELVFEGKLQIIKGKGTFVTASDLMIEIENFNGFLCSFFSNRVVNKDDFDSLEVIHDIKKEIKESFVNVDLNQGVYKLQKSLYEKDVVYAYSVSYIPVVFFPNLLEDIKLGKNLVDITVNKYAYLPSKASCDVFVSTASSHTSEVLDVSRGTPILTSLAKLKSKSEAICEVIEINMRSDICKIKL